MNRINPKELTISEAKKTDERIHMLKLQIGRSFLELANELKKMRDKKLYVKLGFPTFEIYIEQPELKFERSNVYMLIGIYEDFIESKMSIMMDIESIDYNKLEMIRRFKYEEDFDEWIEKAKNLNRSELRIEIQERLLGESSESLDDRAIIPYDENIYFLSNKFQEKREGDFKLIGEGEIFPTLKRRSWFFHKETGAEFTLREYARVQTFPDTFSFVGTYETIKDQIGNAVAPQMAKHVGQELEGRTFGDLFAGCGGLSHGLEMLGKRAVWAVERNTKYARTYKANHPHALIITRDIKKLDPIDFKKVDIIVGGPPCQGFSLSGLRFKNDPRNELYKEFLRFVVVLKPKEFLMENVKEIQAFKRQITKDFERVGYETHAELVEGLEIGMRQRRDRFFFIGRKK